MQQDPLADALSRIKNAEISGKRTCTVRPGSKLIGRVLQVMQDGGYIVEYEHRDDAHGGEFFVTLHGLINDCGVIKPRYSVKTSEFETWESRYLPAQDFGALIVTTTEGVVTHATAKENNTGGRLLAYVY